MKREKITGEVLELRDLCTSVKLFIKKGDYEKSNRLICEAMGRFPHSPQPHNLLGVLMEVTGDHVMAMKHFRAAWDLDPTYKPARQNLSICGNTITDNLCAYDENDCA